MDSASDLESAWDKQFGQSAAGGHAASTAAPDDLEAQWRQFQAAKPAPGPGLGDTLGDIASSIGYGVTNLPNLGADLIEKVAPLPQVAPVTREDIARDEFRKAAQTADASNPQAGLQIAQDIAQQLHTTPAAIVDVNQPAPIDYRALNPNGPAGAALAAMETASRGVVKTPLDVSAGALSVADLLGLDHPQDKIFAGEHAADEDAATRAAQSAHPLTTAGTGLATNLATFAAMPEADLGKLTVKAEQFAAEHPGVAGKLTQYLTRTLSNTPRAAVAGGIPQGEDTAQQTLANGGTLPQAYGEAAANTGLGTLAFQLPASLGGPAPARAVGGAALQAGANYGQQAASHAIAPQVFPAAQVSPEAAGLGALFGLLGGHGEAPAAEAPRAAEPVPALDTIAAKMRAELKAQGLSDAQIDAILNPAPEPSTAALPAPVVQVDTAGNAATQAQADAARRAAETLGLTPDVLKAQAARATGSEAAGASPTPEPAPREPLALPPPVVQVDRAGTARTSSDFMQELVAAQQAARNRVEMGLTPDVERAQAARNAPLLARQEQERANPSPATIDDVLAEVEGLQHAPEGAPTPELGTPAPAPEKVDAYFANLPKEIGWEQRGGKLLRGGAEMDAGENAMRSAGGSNAGDVIGRTSWIPKIGGDGQPSVFWRMRPDARLTEAQAHEAFRKVAAREPLRPIEQRFIEYARQTAHDYAQAEAEDTARFEAEQNEADDLERQRAIEELRNESARFATADHAEAFSVAQWARRAREAGMTLDETLAALGEGDNGTRISNLAKTIADKENTRGTDTQPDGLGSESGIREGGEGQAAVVRESPGETGQAVSASEGARADLFPPATAREQVAAAERAKDDARNGNTGRVIPGFEGTDLGATPHGEAPEQARIPEDDKPDAPLDIRYGKRRVPPALGSKAKPSDIPESSGLEVTEHTKGEIPPEIAELQARHAARADDATMSEHLRQENVSQGEREARERGLRGAVGDAIGDHRVTFVHDEEGLPQDLRARLGDLREGNVRYGLYDAREGTVYVFTKHVRTPERAAWTTAHEIAGHKGIRGLVEALTQNDSKLGGVRLGARTPLDALHAAMDLARQNPTVAKIADAIAEQRGMNDAHLATEEALAELAAATRTGRFDEIARKYGVEVPAGVRAGVQGAIKNFVARLRKILNTIYAKLTGKPETFSDEDVHALLADAWSQVHGAESEGLPDGEALASEEPQDRAGEMGHGASGPASAGATGVKNEQVKAERAARGLDELDVEGRRSYGRVWTAAESTLRDDPQAGLRLADEIARKPRALTPEEQVVLAQDRARIFVDRHKAAEAVNAAVKAGDAKGEAVARDRLFRANQQLEISDIAARQSGYEQGLALSVRRMMAELDYSREGMETRLQAAKGKPLDVEELNKLRDLHQKMQDVEAKIAGRTEAKQARQKETKVQLQEQLRLFRDHLREADSRRDAIRQKQLRKQIAELARRIVEGDYSKVQRTPIQYNEETRKLEAERNRLRGTFEEMAAKAERMNRSPVKKTLSMIHDLQMASILASLHVYKKLAYAVGGGHAMSLLADATRSVARHVPGIKGTAEQAPQYGRGLDAAALRARAHGIKEAPKEAVNQLRYGMATREAAHGMGRGFSDEYFTFAGTLADAIKTPGLLNKAAETTRALAGYVGRTHAAEKEFLAQPEFREGIVRQTQFLTRQMEKAGKSKDEIAEEMGKESTQAAIGAKALERAFESKMQGKNDFSRSIDAMIGTLDRSQNAGANFLGFMLKTIFPIRKVGVNVVVQGTSLMGGGLKALSAALKKGDMTPERADYIMKNIGQQGAGAVLLALGAIYYNQFGGVPGVFSKKDQPKHKDALGNVIKPGEANGFGTEAFHGAPAAMIQIGASMAQVLQKEHGKRNGLDLALNVAARPTLAWLVRTIPYTDTIRRMTNTAEYGRGRKEGALGAVGEISGQTARGILVPGVVQQAAAASDPYKGFRHPRNFGEDVKLGIPGLREQVPKERR